ncbi:magnesium/cobalt transporter CorA [Parachryseolinea silvisoli]|uniref:magnesium/cobalt transporter CorA n=1 Tax=Parachryseolinea silvisoli TaxID=2873601 RepID=UPI00226595F1|nr:magnesium/cobalt transporter CorA [Parachryseolinea silvisoli]MCD9016267.1 magnesium/cobalt transporter CorA [Parachryseolinea silvisoli]
MIRVYTLRQGKLEQHKNPPHEEIMKLSNIIWIDLQSPSQQEKVFVERNFKIEFFTHQEAQEIESSSRFLETEETIEINLGFISSDVELSVQNVTFILKGNILFTYRQGDLKTFAEAVRKLKSMNAETKEHGLDIFLTILESRIDSDADLIESINRRVNAISKELIARESLKEDMLLNIAQLQENTMLLHETITEKQRVVSSLIRIPEFNKIENERLKVIIKDIGSLLQHAQFSSERLEYLQNTFLGLVNIEQNTVIKIFTVVTVVFMPPTLIASIYGMNFKAMPELGWTGGYPFAIGLMIFSSLAFLWYFKRKKWL